MLGLHWVSELHGCEPDQLTAERVREALIEVPRLLGLHAVGPPQLSEHSDPNEEASIAGIVLLRESHASCHVFRESRVVHLDVFCCRTVDFEPAGRFASRHFGATQADARVLERGGRDEAGSLRELVRRVR